MEIHLFTIWGGMGVLAVLCTIGGGFIYFLGRGYSKDEAMDDLLTQADEHGFNVSNAPEIDER